MDVSKVVWILVIVAVIGGGWLLTSGGVNWQQKKYTEATPGTDEEQDKLDEAGLSKLAGFLMMTFRYERAAEVYKLAIDRYGTSGKNYWWNNYQYARALEKLEKYPEAVQVLEGLRDANADAQDERVPNFDNLNLRIGKLRETHEMN